MSAPRLIDGIRRPLPLFDAEAGERALNAARRASGDVADVLSSHREAADFLASVFAASPYLARIAASNPEVLLETLHGDPSQILRDSVTRVGQLARVGDENKLAIELRAEKRRVHFATAVADLAGVWTLDQVTRSLSEFADACIEAALTDQCRRDGAAGRIAERETAAEGLFVLALGKLGGRELNYSSDVDLIVGFDADMLRSRGVEDPQSYASRAAKVVVARLQERSEHGFVFRVDLRLRPDPGATPPAVSMNAALRYYEAMGRSWERAAFIKARCCAGHRSAAEAFLSQLTPFVWRRSLDFAAVADIHDLKRRVQDLAASPGADLGGWNVKTGRGGIREIEFFAQTQQLLFGGRDPSLRVGDTRGALKALAAAGIAEAETQELLDECYVAHRNLEHRIQMVEDQQAHDIPVAVAERRRVAALFGAESPADFERELAARARTVGEIYDLLFADASNETDIRLPPDEDELQSWLAAIGFAQPRGVAATLDSWRAGRVRATRAARARELLEQLAPIILEAAAEQADPDQAFARFADFFESLNAGVQVMSLFAAEPRMLKDVVSMLTCAPRLGAELARQTGAFDIMFDPSFGEAVVDGAASAAKRAQDASEQAPGFEVAINAMRRIGREERFRIGAHLLMGRARPLEAQAAYSSLADGLAVAASTAAVKEVVRRHGEIGGRFVVLGLGKLGGRELAADSDLDLMLVYEADEGAVSDGARPMTADAYFGRLTQRLIAALSAPTEEGDLYEVDMKLRPSGSAGPIAVSLAAFENYYEQVAWTWEMMVLTRARPIAGHPDLADALTQRIRDALVRPRKAAAGLQDVADMRSRVRQEKPARGVWDIKQAPGGLLDIEFVAQGLQIVHAAQHPDILANSTLDALDRLARFALISAKDAAVLREALALQLQARQVLALSIDGVFAPEESSPALRDLLAAACDRATFDDLAADLTSLQERAAAICSRLLPAAQG